MKRHLFHILLLITVLGSACTKDLTDRFSNPDVLNQGVADPVPGMLTSTLVNVYINTEDYFEWYYMLADGLGITGYSQICERYVSTRYGFFSQYNDLVNGNGFEDYGMTSVGGHIAFENTYLYLKTWQSIKDLRDSRSGQDKLDADVYYKMVSVIRLFQTGRLVDLSNSVPYFNAFQGTVGTAANYFPAYDDPQKIYESMIDELGHLVDSLPIAYNQMSSNGKSLLQTQDVAFQGDINKWVQYANALRLKFLVRISGVDPGFLQSRLQTTLTKPLPTQDLYWHPAAATDLVNGITWQRGIREQPYTTFIPNIIMRRMNYGTPAYEPGIDDPRLPVLALPTKYHDYRGVSYNIDSQTVVYNSGEKYYAYADNINSSLTTNAKSMYSHVTFHNNPNLPVYMFTLGETDLLLAEIELKGLASTGEAAGDHIKDEVIHSTNFWYAMNATSSYPATVVNGSAPPDANTHTFDTLLHPILPSAGAIAAWGDNIKSRFNLAAGPDDQMDILMQQKYIHLNLMEIEELWAELRRTRHPKLEPFTWQGTVMTPQPERIHYPTSELSGNSQNFLKVSAQNNNTSPIFWVPPALTGTVPYWSNYNYQ
jgi:SusD/RagB-like outer membrane lipoprotein